MAATTTTLDAIVKTFYVDNEVKEQLNMESYLYDKLKRFQQLVDGKNYTYAIRESRNRNAGQGYSEGGAFAAASNQGTRNIIVPNKRISTSIEISGDLVRAATGPGKGAFVSALQMEVEYGRKDMIRSINRQLHSDGTDAFAFWTAADDTSGTNVDDGQGNAFVHLETGATTLDLIDASDHATQLGTAIVVTLGAEAAANWAVTWTGTVSGSADGDYLVLPGSIGKQLMGIRGVVSASNPPTLSSGLHGLAVATYGYWKAQSFTASANRDLTHALLIAPLTAIGTKSGLRESDVKFLMCNGPVRDKIVDLLLADNRTVNTTALKGGFSSVDYNGTPVVVDPQCRRNSLYYIAPSTMDILTSSDGIKWAGMDGGQHWQMKPATSSYADAFQSFLVFYGDLAVKQRNGNAILADLAE